MKFKIHAGQIVELPKFVKPEHLKEDFKSRDLSIMFGNMTHGYTDQWGMPNNFSLSVAVDSAQIITEDNKVNFVGAAGWGIVGGFLTGGVGLLAGALLGGRGKETFCAVRFKDGTQFVVSGKPKEVVTLLR